MNNYKSLIGATFNRWTVIEYKGVNEHQNRMWLCQCVCGNKSIIVGYSLKGGYSKSCGCLQIEATIKANTKHGLARKISTYTIWVGIKDRCYRKKNEKYLYYGGRGITVCERWINSFSSFLEDMGPRPSKKHSLDRWPDMNGNYEPTNCRWATSSEQSANTRRNKWYEYDGERRILADWAKKLCVTSSNIKYHMETKTFTQVIEFYKNKKGGFCN